MTARHAGQNTSRPDYAYTGRHEAPAAEGCRAVTAVASGDGERGGLLVCNWEEHEGSGHFDQADGIYWATVMAGQETHLAEPAGAVA